MISDWQLLVRVLGALFLGGIVGFEREQEQKPAGLRTVMLVALGSTLVMLVAQRSPSFFVVAGAGSIDLDLDPTRILGSLVQGVGFLGAGTIFMHRRTVHGLTTAAAVWMMAVVGAAVGVGDWTLAIAGTLAAYFILRVLGPFGARFGEKKSSEEEPECPEEEGV